MPPRTTIFQLWVERDLWIAMKIIKQIDPSFHLYEQYIITLVHLFSINESTIISLYTKFRIIKETQIFSR